MRSSISKNIVNFLLIIRLVPHPHLFLTAPAPVEYDKNQFKKTGEHNYGIYSSSYHRQRSGQPRPAGGYQRPAICAMLEKAGFTVTYTAIVPDEIPQIQTELTTAADGRHINLIITTGGTGLSPRDVTPEATLAVLDREIRAIRWPCGWRALKLPPAPCFPEP